jgi:hypothetical protein
MVQPVTGRYQEWKGHATNQNGNTVVRNKRLETLTLQGGEGKEREDEGVEEEAYLPLVYLTGTVSCH